MDKYLKYLDKVPIWWVALTLWGAMCLRMCIAGLDGDLTSEQGGWGYLMAFCFLMMAHAWRSCYKQYKQLVDNMMKDLEKK